DPPPAPEPLEPNTHCKPAPAPMGTEHSLRNEAREETALENRETNPISRPHPDRDLHGNSPLRTRSLLAEDRRPETITETSSSVMRSPLSRAALPRSSGGALST